MKKTTLKFLLSPLLLANASTSIASAHAMSQVTHSIAHGWQRISQRMQQNYAKRLQSDLTHPNYLSLFFLVGIPLAHTAHALACWVQERQKIKQESARVLSEMLTLSQRANNNINHNERLHEGCFLLLDTQIQERARSQYGTEIAPDQWPLETILAYAGFSEKDIAEARANKAKLDRLNQAKAAVNQLLISRKLAEIAEQNQPRINRPFKQAMFGLLAVLSGGSTLMGIYKLGSLGRLLL